MSNIGVDGFVIFQLRRRIHSHKATLVRKQKKIAAMEKELSRLLKKMGRFWGCECYQCKKVALWFWAI